MTLFPVLHKTIVSSLKDYEVLEKIQKTTLSHIDEDPEKKSFRGLIFKNNFRISLKTIPPQHSIPLVIGRVESTSQGSIIFLTFKLFPSSNLYLWTSFALCIACALVFLILAKIMNAGFIALTIGILNYIILIINFNRKSKLSIDKISEVLWEE